MANTILSDSENDQDLGANSSTPTGATTTSQHGKGKRKATDADSERPVEVINIDDGDDGASKGSATADVDYFFGEIFIRPHPEKPGQSQKVRKCNICV